MAIPFDLDLPLFLWINLKTILGTKKRLRESTRRIPLKYAFEEVPAEKLTQAQKEYMRPMDEQLAALHYFPVATFRITNFNFGTTLHRRYGKPTDPVSCGLSIIEVKAEPFLKRCRRLLQERSCRFLVRPGNSNSVRARPEAPRISSGYLAKAAQGRPFLRRGCRASASTRRRCSCWGNFERPTTAAGRKAILRTCCG